MNKMILLTGGARSGKSAFAEKLALQTGEKIAYIATAIPFDKGMKDRIKKHRQQRPDNWETFEAYKDIYSIIKKIKDCKDCIIIDCITLMITNLILENKGVDWNEYNCKIFDELELYVTDQVIKLIQEIKKSNCVVILVTNEVGCGIVPDNNMSIVFRDIAGRINQLLAKESDEVYFLTCGIPIKIK